MNKLSPFALFVIIALAFPTIAAADCNQLIIYAEQSSWTASRSDMECIFGVEVNEVNSQNFTLNSITSLYGQDCTIKFTNSKSKKTATYRFRQTMSKDPTCRIMVEHLRGETFVYQIMPVSWQSQTAGRVVIVD